ncbi:Kinesin heavy chain [Entamoeba marina]
MQTESSVWFGGLISDAITLSHQTNRIIVLVVVDETPLSTTVINLFENDLSTIIKEQTNALILRDGDENIDFFKSLYTSPIQFPSVFFFTKNGLHSILVDNDITKDAISTHILQASISTAFSQQSTQPKPQEQPKQTPSQQEKESQNEQNQPKQQETTTLRPPKPKDHDKQMEILMAEKKRRERLQKERELQREREEIALKKEMTELERRRKEDEEYRQLLIKRIEEEKEIKLLQQQREAEELNALHQHQLPNDNTLQHVYNTIENWGYPSDQYTLVDAVKKSAIVDMDKSLFQLNLWPSSMVHIARTSPTTLPQPHFGNTSNNTQTWYEWFTSWF